MTEDTIAAIGTPAGTGGIGIVRISGEEAKVILGKIFGPAPMERPRELCYGHIADPTTGEVVDEVLAVYMPGSKTYTAEDVVEINCHGGPLPLTRTLELILSQGARLAEPGEFTKRAFLNGRIDLSRAEAVIDVIDAKTGAALDAALDQLRGRFAEEIESIRKDLVDLLVEIDVNIDYPDEDIEELLYEKICRSLGSIKCRVDKLIETAEAGRILRDGLGVAIVGKPNVGKSSLMNELLRESRAIVTDIPGTTRDTIEEYANIKGLPVRLIDTAGIRDTGDVIEQIGIERSKKSLEDADLVVFMVDGSQALDEDDGRILAGLPAERTLVIINKEDKGLRLTEEERKTLAAASMEVMEASMKDQRAKEKIEEAIYRFGSGAAGGDAAGARSTNAAGARSIIVTNLRHKMMLQSASRALADALTAAEGGGAPELLEIDCRTAYESLGFITGDSVQDDVIDQIFSRFCLGK